MPPTTPRQDLGRRGEDLAADFLRRQGFHIRETNVRSRLGEIDIVADAPVANNDQVLVFVEVKTRRATIFGSPLEAVGVVKQRRLTRLAAAYLQQYPALAGRSCRFDVIGITIDSADEAKIEHIPSAF